MSNPNENKRRIMPIDEERKRIFLEVLERTGSIHEAAAAASPHASEAHAATSTFRMLRDRDPEFAARMESARQKFLGKAESALTDRAFTPGLRESFDDKGNLRSREISWRDANHLLLRLLGKHDPSWREGRNVQVAGTIEHTSGAGNEYRISAADVLALAPEDRRVMIDLLGKVEANRLASEGDNANGRELIEPAKSLSATQN